MKKLLGLFVLILPPSPAFFVSDLEDRSAVTTDALCDLKLTLLKLHGVDRHSGCFQVQQSCPTHLLGDVIGFGFQCCVRAI